MNVAGRELTEITLDRARDQYDALLEQAAGAPSMLTSVAYRIGQIPPRALHGDDDIIDALLAVAEITVAEDGAFDEGTEAERRVAKAVRAESKKWRKKVRKALERGHADLLYTVLNPDALGRQAAVDAEAEKIRIREDARRLVAEEAAGDGGDGELYVDVAALGDEIESPKASAGMVRDDGTYTLVPYEWNAANGHPGAFKSGLAALHAVETFKRGGRVQWYDVDGNSAQSVLARLVAAGAPLDVLRDHDRFRLTISSMSTTLLDTAKDAKAWLTVDDLVVMDAAGGLVTSFGGDSNDADDWMRIYQQMLAPLVSTGAAGLLIDHFAKTSTNSDYATGSGAKKKTIHGIIYAVSPFKDQPPRPESVGKIALTLVKDTHGATGYAVGECVAVLEVDSRDAAHGPWSWRLMPGRPKDERDADRAEADVDVVLALDPFPTSRDKLHAALIAAEGKGWRADREHAALTEARHRRNSATILTTENKE